MRQGYYTLLFDNEKHMEIVKDTSVNHAVVEKIHFDTQSIEQFVFDRKHGAWMLTLLRTIPITRDINASFLTFYHQFASDKAFQEKREKSLASTVQFVGPDPDDDFNMMEGIITPDTWEAFAPQLPSKMIYNIIYGKPEREGDSKVFVMRGIANGLELEMTFKRKNGETDETDYITVNGYWLMVNEVNYSLLHHNTFGIDVKCRRFLEYASVEEAQEIARQLQEPYLLIGAGSNLLLTGDFDGTVIHSAVKGIENQSDSRIRCGSGETWDEVVAWCVGHGFYGAEVR